MEKKKCYAFSLTGILNDQFNDQSSVRRLLPENVFNAFLLIMIVSPSSSTLYGMFGLKKSVYVCVYVFGAKYRKCLLGE